MFSHKVKNNIVLHGAGSFIILVEALLLKASPADIQKVCVSACTQKTPNLRCFLKRHLTKKNRRHRLADGQLSLPYPPSPSFRSFGAASVMLCCSPPPASSSTPLRPSVCYPSISLVVNIMIFGIFCDHLNVLFIFDPPCIVKSGWTSTARMPAPRR